MPHRNRPSRFRQLLLLAAFLGCLALPAGASAATTRIAYVSNGLGGSQNISFLKINANGSLTPVAGSPLATGANLLEGIAITPNARNVYAASFGTQKVLGYKTGVTGALSGVFGNPFATGAPDRTPLGVSPSPLGGRIFVWNHGSNVGSWRIRAFPKLLAGQLLQAAGSPFPVHVGHTNPFAGAVHPNGKFLYVPMENTVPGGGTPDRLTVYSIATTGVLTEIQAVATGNNPFGSAVTPNGKFLYVSNPEPDPGFPNGSISAYAIGATGLLTEIPGSKFNVAPGNHPLAMAITPSGKTLYVATRVTNTVNAYSINQTTGALAPVPGSPFATGGTNGKAVALTPDGKRLYVSNQVSNNVSGFNVGANGALTAIPGSPWLTGGTSPDLESIVITPNQPPQAQFTGKIKEAGTASKFDASAAADTDGGTIDTYDWFFGDGTSKTTTTPTVKHKYTHKGTFNVSLVVTDNEGCNIDRIFTGKATLCNGSLLAKAAGTATVPAPTPPGPPVAPGVFRGGQSLGGRGVPTGAPRCFGRRATIVGNNRRNRIKGTKKNDVIVGRGGGDRISGGRGNDTICGGSGNDRLSGGKGRDRISGGKGRDRIRGGPGRDRLSGGPGKDSVKQ